MVIQSGGVEKNLWNHFLCSDFINQHFPDQYIQGNYRKQKCGLFAAVTIVSHAVRFLFWFWEKFYTNEQIIYFTPHTNSECRFKIQHEKTQYT